jgi:hypothetical protein
MSGTLKTIALFLKLIALRGAGHFKNARKRMVSHLVKVGRKHFRLAHKIHVENLNQRMRYCFADDPLITKKLLNFSLGQKIVRDVCLGS